MPQSAPHEEGGRNIEPDLSLENDSYTQLKELILGTEQAQLQRLQKRIDDLELRGEDIAEVLPAAVDRSAARSGRLRASLQPITEQLIEASVRRNPSVLANALYPAIGGAIRQAVATALAGMMQSLNAVVEKSVSWRSLRWRVEALRTGKSFGEVALLHSLLYRVEQVFLIHKRTGLSLCRESAPGAELKDADLVSGMLTAIQDFVHDSFAGEEGGELERVQVGDYRVWVQHGPDAVLAVLVRGTPPVQVRTVFQEVLESIHSKMRPALEAFDGNAAPFAACREDLQRCFLGRAEAASRRIPIWYWLIPAALVLVLGYLGFLHFRQQRRVDDYVSRLQDEPGLIIAQSEKRDGKWHLTGLRDPFATDPLELLAGAEIEAQDLIINLEPYQSLEGLFPALRDLETKAEALEVRRISFPSNSSELPSASLGDIQAVVTDIRAILAGAEKTGKNAVVEIRGGTDEFGDSEKNAVLAAERAEVVKTILETHGIPPARLRIWTELAESSDQESPEWQHALARSASFRTVWED